MKKIPRVGKRRLIEWMAKDYGLSLSLSCKVLSINHSAYYYRPKKRLADETIKDRLKQLAETHPHCGFDKMMNTIKQTQSGWNHKRIYRLYCELKLNLRVKPKKCFRLAKCALLHNPFPLTSVGQ